MHQVHVRKSEDNLPDSVLSCHVDAGNLAQAIRLGADHLDSLSQLTGLPQAFLMDKAFMLLSE